MALLIPIVGVNFTSVAVESLLYGVFLLLSAISFYLLFTKEKLSDRPRSSRFSALTTPLILANIVITTAVTGHWVLSLVRTVDAHLRFNNGDTPQEYLEDLRRPVFLASTAILIVTLITGDCIMIYRLKTVFKYNRSTIVFPLCCLFGFIACGIGTVFQFSKLSSEHNVFLASIGIVFTFITNVFCSSFIAFKIHRVNSAATNYNGQNLGSITGIIVESAALYTSWTIMLMAAFLAGSNLVYVFADTISVITGISFMLINVRIGLGWAIDLAKSLERSTAHSISLRPTNASSAIRSVDDRRTANYQMRSLTVHVERTVVKESSEDGVSPGVDLHGSLPAKELESVSDRASSKQTHERKGYI
ncbi:hypothetical protein FA15DRAFT_674244 [Coprinopsis marcescibilis]|uniref:Uncharacterized protein n=1 Tax=Coprinopsis marcescibilis TaxID=230819 RepID=A0A5C3KHY1_COPMA|nr:hypothetical protein FA15DRAFT_674244 [Coprinopsis marcescibilis]